MVDSSHLHAHLLENNPIYWRRSRTTTISEAEGGGGGFAL